MEGGISVDAPLDFASFQIWPTQNSYEVFVCSNNKIEKLDSGLLEHIVLHLPQLKESHHERPGDHFKLQLPENLKGSTWFSKSTLARFLHIVGVPELLKSANVIGDEMSQLEEARKFHLTLYAQGHQDELGDEKSGGHNSKDMEITSKPEPKITSADATKNELVRAMDLRLAALREELIAAFSEATNGTCSCKQIADLVTFSQYFGAVNLRSSLSKYLELIQNNQNLDCLNEQPKCSPNSANDNDKVEKGAIPSLVPVVMPITYGASPAKAAQVERHISESEESSNSSAEDQPYIERSRSLVRSASPRRSASPMRRIQIGRSGSRRAIALTIRSLSYIPAKERISHATGKSSDEESGQSLKKPESNASSMSVKDTISLFERKQRDQSPDLQKMRIGADTSVNTSKSVLRRWSAGMADPPTQPTSENANVSINGMSSNSLVAGVTQRRPLEENPDGDGTVESTTFVRTVEEKPDGDRTVESTTFVGTVDEDASLTTGEGNTCDSVEELPDKDLELEAETNNKVTASADWNRQKQDELNLMMMKMMESKPSRNRRMGIGVSRSQELPSGKRGGFYDHYKQKRDEKLQGENSGKKRTEKEEKFKTLQGILDQRKVEKSVGVAGKQDSIGKPRKPQKNPSPPSQPRKEPSKSLSPLLQPKKDSSKPAAPKKISPKASPLPATRKSWPSAPSPKTSSVALKKTPNWISSTGTTPTRKKSQPPASPIQSSPKVERPQQKPKSTKGTQTEAKASIKGQEGKKQRSVTTSSNSAEVKDESGVSPAKPSFYNKVTKKGSVVPLESKPFLRKRSGTGPGVGPVKMKDSQPDEVMTCGNMIQDLEAASEMSKSISSKEEDIILPTNECTDLQQEDTVNSHQKFEEANNYIQFVSESDEKTTEPLEGAQPDNESDISPAAWVDIEEHQEVPVSCDTSTQAAAPTNAEPVASCPRVRHSLSQMLQEDGGEPEIIEWGNAENPPAIVYPKDAAKGLKRLLKFARKSKGEATATGWSSPSVFSDGEEDAEESKAASKRHADAMLRKASLQAKGFGQLRTSLGASYDGGNPSRGTDYTAVHDLSSGQSNTSKLQEGHISGATSNKPTRSFFSLSTFRSSKSNETKPR